MSDRERALDLDAAEHRIKMFGWLSRKDSYSLIAEVRRLQQERDCIGDGLAQMEGERDAAIGDVAGVTGRLYGRLMAWRDRALKAEAERDQLRTALQEAANKFRQYATMHANKLTLAGRVKSETNLEMAERMERALAPPSAPGANKENKGEIE